MEPDRLATVAVEPGFVSGVLESPQRVPAGLGLAAGRAEDERIGMNPMKSAAGLARAMLAQLARERREHPHGRGARWTLDWDPLRESGSETLGLPIDVTDGLGVKSAIRTVEQELGPVTLLVNNAGTLEAIGPTWQLDPEVWWRDIETHVRGALHCTSAVLPGMIQRATGRIVNVVGMLGQQGEPYVSAYACAKAALFRMIDCLASELRDQPIALFCISPGLVRTEMTRRLAEEAEGRRWLPGFGEVPADGWRSPDLAGRLVVRIARGEADALSGRYLHVSLDLDEAIVQAEEILAADRLTLRLVR